MPKQTLAPFIVIGVAFGVLGPAIYGINYLWHGRMRPMGVDSWRRHMLARDEAVFATRKKIAAMEAQEAQQQEALAE
eukprot:CAMPEP_0196780244 /NCGR_PEP_ID=MMETSP1104-20130614/7350_1 /TAXON_ID=33652 /ORGANISM="Cafeteria sp., Strain Caron Lab Isolate" /LENGTH=76 /DNA_ID=CAMNT_0042150441 /DNA_START=12 /DNA_END=242 /DNA_ORIENTATION=+